MYCIDKLISNGYNFLIFYFDDKTDISELDLFNYGYLISARYCATHKQNEEECVEIINECADDIFAKFNEIIVANPKLYQHFNIEKVFSRNTIQKYPEMGRSYVIYYEVYLKLELIQKQ